MSDLWCFYFACPELRPLDNHHSWQPLFFFTFLYCCLIISNMPWGGFLNDCQLFYFHLIKHACICSWGQMFKVCKYLASIMNLWCGKRSWIQFQIFPLWGDLLPWRCAASSVCPPSPRLWTVHRCRPTARVLGREPMWDAKVISFHALCCRQKTSPSLPQHHQHSE